MKTRPINCESVIDSRDVIDAIAEMESDRECLREEFDEDPANAGVDFDNWVCNSTGDAWSREEQDELIALKALAKEAEGCCEDWSHGATLIHHAYFVDYCEELLIDIGALPKDIPDYLVIDWNATAKNLKVDYAEVDFNGRTYFIR
jgi:hypothetical protein